MLLANEMKDHIRKNLLDLHYQKYNSAMNTTIVIIFTLLISLGIGVTVALLTGQLEWNSKVQFTIILLSLVTLFVGLMLVRYFYKHTTAIIKELKQMRQEDLHHL